MSAQSDPTLTLAQILSDKGTISVAELAKVQSADQSARLGLLAGILKDKGLLDTGDLAKLSLPAAPATPIATPVAVATAEKPAARKTETASIPVSTKKGVPISVYGEVLMTAGANTANFNIEDLPMIANKQGTDATGGDKNFFAEARQTRIGVTLDPIDALGGKLSGDFEVDLMGGEAPYSNGAHFDIFRMRLAYGRIDWNNWAIEAGQDWDIFAPLNPTSLNEFGIPEFTATGNAWTRAPQIRVEGKTKNASGNNLLWQLAATDPNAGDQSTTALVVSRQPGVGERGRMPALESRAAFVKSYHDRDFAVGFSGRYDREKNYGTIGALNVQTPLNSWGVALDFSLPITRMLAVTGEAYQGNALGIYAIASGEAVGAVGTTGARGVFSRGGWAQLQMNWTKKWQTNLAYGVDQPQDSNLAVGSRSRNQQYMANVIDRMTRNIAMSLEYRRILTDYRNQLTADERGDHIDLGLAFIF